MIKKLVLVGTIAVGGLIPASADILSVRQAREEYYEAKRTMEEAKRIAAVYDNLKDDAIRNFRISKTNLKIAKKFNGSQHKTTQSSIAAHNERAEVYFPQGKPSGGITYTNLGQQSSNKYFEERGEF